MRHLTALAAFFCMLGLSAGIFGQAVDPTPSLLGVISERPQDVEFLMEELPKLHIRPFEKVSEGAWRRTGTQLAIEAPLLSDVDYYLRLCQMVAMLGDSHTCVGKAPGIAFRGYPFSVAPFAEGLCVVAVAKEHESLLGVRLLKIGETNIAEAEPRITTLFPSENRASALNGLCQYVTQAEPLVYLQLIEKAEAAPFTFEGPGGTELVARFDPVDPNGPRPEIATLPSVPRDRWPVSFKRDRDYWFERLDHKAIYVRYDVCRDDPQRPFKEFVESISKAIDETGAERVVIDLRSNGGGDSSVMAPLTKLIRSQEALKKKGAVAVLIGRRTFSSAQLNAVELQRECSAVLVGMPTGQKPNAFGEVRRFNLPSSGIEILYSTKEFRTAPPGEDPESTMPDVRVEPSIRDLAEGRDPTLERALALPLEAR